MCTLCGETVKGYYRNPHPGKSWCACLNISSGRTPEKPWANTAAFHYGKNFDFDTIKTKIMSKINYDAFNADNARFIAKEALKNELERTIDTIIKLAEVGEEFFFPKVTMVGHTAKPTISKETFDELEKRGFKIVDNGAISWVKIDDLKP